MTDLYTGPKRKLRLATMFGEKVESEGNIAYVFRGNAYQVRVEPIDPKIVGHMKHMYEKFGTYKKQLIALGELDANQL